MMYTVNQLAEKAGITPRALRHYDRIGLLKPAEIAKNGYRQYSENELIRLQQILFFRELDFPLEEIQKMIDHPRFDLADAFRYQRGLLELKRKRLGAIIKSIDTTLTSMQDDNITDQERDLYGSLSDEEIRQYKNEAKARWGGTDAYKQSQERYAKFSKEEIAEIKEAGEVLCRELADAVERGIAPESDEFQALVQRHFEGINVFYDCSMEIYRGLADMYLQDERFADYYRKFHQHLPEKLVEGMRFYADKKEGK
ncbi:MAG: MerR family transcriptional regulator [Candidatus Nomurabacteria bacterium]|nr:MAG: MerR family transcriptional regulator [Candidatus Nomurabacteria bacterium]